jgi:fructose-1,6-bisphosphatase/inositol monophosphatase family enzyme
MAAGALILEEAGGKVSDPAGGPLNIMSRRVLGTNGRLHAKFVDILKQGPLAKDEPAP